MWQGLVHIPRQVVRLATTFSSFPTVNFDNKKWATYTTNGYQFFTFTHSVRPVSNNHASVFNNHATCSPTMLSCTVIGQVWYYVVGGGTGFIDPFLALMLHVLDWLPHWLARLVGCHGGARLGVRFAGVYKFVYATVNISCQSQKNLPTLVLMFLSQKERIKQKRWTESERTAAWVSTMIPPGKVENSSLTGKKIMFSLTVKRHLTVQGFHQNLKTEFHEFSMTDLPFSMTPILTLFQIWLCLCLTTCTTITN